MATLRQHIATNVLMVTRFRDLLRKVRSYRPDDDQALIKKAYEFSLEHHKGQVRDSGEPYLVHPLEVATLLAEMRLDPTATRARPSDLKAYEFSLEHHKGQVRDSGEPYLVHPLEVATLLAEMRLDPTAIVAGLLHDAVEDTSVTIEEIKAEFGEQVAHIVEGVTKISKIEFASSEEAQAENVRKMVLAMMDDIRVVLIKLADRLHNMRTLKFLSPERQHKIAKETLEIYAPRSKNVV